MTKREKSNDYFLAVLFIPLIWMVHLFLQSLGTHLMPSVPMTLPTIPIITLAEIILTA